MKCRTNTDVRSPGEESIKETAYYINSTNKKTPDALRLVNHLSCLHDDIKNGKH